METEERASAEVADEVESEDTVEKVRSGDGHEEMAGVGERDGEGDEARMAEDSESIKSSIVAHSLSGDGDDDDGLLQIRVLVIWWCEQISEEHGGRDTNFGRDKLVSHSGFEGERDRWGDNGC